MAKTAKSNSAGAATIVYTDTQHTASQTQIVREVLELFDRITLLLLQRLIKLSRRETGGLLIPFKWHEGNEELFQLLVELIRTPLHPLAEEGPKRLAKILDIVIEALNSDGFDWRTGQC